VINETLRVVNIIGGVFRRAKTELHFKGRQAQSLSTPISACFSMSLKFSLQGTRFPWGARSSSPSALSTSTTSTLMTPGPSTPGDGRYRYRASFGDEICRCARGVGGPTVYTPFGGGSRLCPGYELARVVISVFLHYLVTRFKYVGMNEHAVCIWEEAEKDRLVFFPTTRTLKSYPINVRRREEEEGA
ncbi:hypothetical protein BHE74_00051746, partial [Ensete ventricosum]